MEDEIVCILCEKQFSLISHALFCSWKQSVQRMRVFFLLQETTRALMFDLNLDKLNYDYKSDMLTH